MAETADKPANADLVNELKWLSRDVRDLMKDLALDQRIDVAVERLADLHSQIKTMIIGAENGAYREVLMASVASDSVSPLLALSNDQKLAWKKLSRWVFTSPDREPFFVLRGYPGTGKTFLMKMLGDLDVTLFFSAPTNKATKVLSKAIGIPAKTTFSTMGLRMVHADEELVMEYGSDAPEFRPGDVLVVDEASMVGKKLLKFIKKVRAEYDLKVLFVGDPAQLNPIGEAFSRAWRVTEDPDCRAFLKHVWRYDNQLLKLSERIRGCMKRKDWRSPVYDDHDDHEGVWLFDTRKRFNDAILELKTPGHFQDTKIVAWRNKTVNRYNDMVRENFGFTERFHIGDLVMLAAPITVDGKVIAHIDDEFMVTEVLDYTVKVYDENGEVDIPVHRLVTIGDTAQVLDIPKDEEALKTLLSRKAKEARDAKTKKDQREKWRRFWEIKDKFHQVRYAYAVTAHRIQGTTLRCVYMDQRDILCNPEKPEAFRALMVACTRPTTCLFTY